MYTSESVKALREERRISQRQLSQLTGLSPSLISAIEAGSRQISSETAEKLDIAFKQILPMQAPKQVTQTELKDPDTIITVDGTPLTNSEREVLAGVATTLIGQRK